MRKFLVLLFTCFACTSASAQQESLKDTVKFKKVLAAYGEGDVIYFRTKKGWGIYNRPEKKVLVQPIYQFTQILTDGAVSRIFFVQNNRVGLMDLTGKVIEKPAYLRLGFAEMNNELPLKIKNDELYYTDSAAARYGTHSMLSNYTEFSVAVHEGMVYVNNYRIGYRAPLVTVTADGMVLDSLDVNGNYIYAEPDPSNNSRVFDLKRNEWGADVTSTGSKVGYCRGNRIAKKEVMSKEGKLVENFVTLNPKTQSTHFFSAEKGVYYIEKKLVMAVLDDYQPGFTYCVDSTRIMRYYIFESGGKYGLYDPYKLKVLVEPTYDFVYVPYDDDKMFTVKNGKVGMADLNTNTQLYENQYTQLQWHKISFDADQYPVMDCDNTFEGQRGQENNGTLPGEELIKEKIRYPHILNGIGVYNGKMIVSDFQPSYETQTYDTDEPMVRNIPGICLSGVFDPALKKWVVPQKYTRISPGEQGYACINACSQNITYAYYTKEGKLLFENLSLDSLRKNEEAQRRLAHVNGKIKLNWVVSSSEWAGDRAVVAANNQYGLYDYGRLEWQVKPVYQYMDANTLAGYFTVVDSGKVGLLDMQGHTIVPAKYAKINLMYDKNLLCANDTFLYAADTMRLAGMADTLKDVEQYRGYNNRMNLNIELDRNKLYTEEEYYDPETMVIDMNTGDVLEIKITDTTRTNIVEIGTRNQVKFDKGWKLLEWEKGFITRNEEGKYLAWDMAGKNPVNLDKRDSAGCNGKWFWYQEADERFSYDAEGKIVAPTDIESRYFVYNYKPVGYAYHYYDGKSFAEGPKDFVVMCANAQGLLLGYEVVSDARTGQNQKRFRYYDRGTKQYSAVELELADSPVKVFPVKDGFVLFDYDTKTKLYTCTVLENDLKTVKSSFKKLTGYNMGKPYRALHPVPYYELYTDRKIVYFDRDFQFIHECNYQDRPETITRFNRIILKSKFKTIVMDWKGRILRQ